MILNFEKQVAEITKILRDADASSSPGLHVAMVLVDVYSRGMAFERERVLAIIARKALNAADLRLRSIGRYDDMSSKRRLARKRCRDKRKYPTVGEAMRFARKIMKSDGDKGKAGAYFCQRCGAYHWGHK